jgi:hypothetical protein
LGVDLAHEIFVLGSNGSRALHERVFRFKWENPTFQAVFFRLFRKCIASKAQSNVDLNFRRGLTQLLGWGS